MKVTELETYLVSVPYKHVEVSTRVQRGGVTAVIVKITCDNGLVGWGPRRFFVGVFPLFPSGLFF